MSRNLAVLRSNVVGTVWKTVSRQGVAHTLNVSRQSGVGHLTFPTITAIDYKTTWPK
jgi:hypothetical protein